MRLCTFVSLMESNGCATRTKIMELVETLNEREQKRDLVLFFVN